MWAEPRLADHTATPGKLITLPTLEFSFGETLGTSIRRGQQGIEKERKVIIDSP